MGGNAHEEEASADYPKAVFTGEEECYTPPELLDAARDALTWEKWPECEAMSRLTGAERLTLAAATQRHANMAALGRRSPSREAMSRPTSTQGRRAAERKPHVEATSRQTGAQGKGLSRAETLREATRGQTGAQGRGSPPRKAMSGPKTGGGCRLDHRRHGRKRHRHHGRWSGLEVAQQGGGEALPNSRFWEPTDG